MSCLESQQEQNMRCQLAPHLINLESFLLPLPNTLAQEPSPLSPSREKSLADHWVEASLVYISFRPVRATGWDPVLKQTQTKSNSKTNKNISILGILITLSQLVKLMPLSLSVLISQFLFDFSISPHLRKPGKLKWITGNITRNSVTCFLIRNFKLVPTRYIPTRYIHVCVP